MKISRRFAVCFNAVILAECALKDVLGGLELICQEIDFIVSACKCKRGRDHSAASKTFYVRNWNLCIALDCVTCSIAYNV